MGRPKKGCECYEGGKPLECDRAIKVNICALTYINHNINNALAIAIATAELNKNRMETEDYQTLINALMRITNTVKQLKEA